MANASTMVRVKEDTKEELEGLKVIREEPIDSVVRRLLLFYREHQKMEEARA